MKTTGQKLVAFLLAALTVMSLMAVSLSNTAYAEVKVLSGGEKCPTEPAGQWIDFSPQGVAWCVSKGDMENLEECEAGDKNPYTIKGQDLCNADAGAAAKAAESQMEKDTWKKFTTLIIGIESMMSAALWPVLALIGGLMNNDILFGPGMEQKLYDIWVPVRNIVNIFFVIALIGLALYSVLGVNSENGQYSIKAMLPKLIAGIIAVNFSFMAIKVVLDAVNVFSTSVFAIPTQVEGLEKVVMDNSDNPEMSKRRKAFCEAVYMDGKEWNADGVKNAALMKIRDRFGLSGVSNPETIIKLSAMLPADKKTAFDADLKKMTEEVAWCTSDESGVKLTTAGQKFFQRYESQNAALAMAINMGEIMFYNRISTSLIGSGTYESLAIKTLFIFLMYVIYGASFIALFVILLARLIVVWLGLAMSPVIALSIAVPMVKDKLGLGELTSKFMKHIIAPVMVAFPMTVGWIMLNALHATSVDPTLSGTKDMLVPGIPIPGLETLQGLLISLATAAVVWIGVFAAAQGTIAEKLTGFMKDQLERFGKFVATAPIKYTPWVPVQMQEGAKEQYSPMALLTAAEQKISDVEMAGKRKFIEAHPEMFERGLTGVDALTTRTTKDELIKVVADEGSKMKDEKYQKKFGDQLKNNPELQRELTTMLSSGIQDEQDFARAMLDAIANPKNLEKVDWGRFQKWAAKRTGEAGKKEAAAEAENAQKAAEVIAKTTLGYNDEELKEGDGKAAVSALAAAAKIKEIDIEKNEGEMDGMVATLKTIKKKGSDTPLSDKEVEEIVTKQASEVEDKEKRKAKVDAAKEAIKRRAEKEKAQTSPAQAQQGGQETSPATDQSQGGDQQPPAPTA